VNQPADLQAELTRRLRLYEATAISAARQFADLMGVAQAIGVRSPLGDMPINRFCVPMFSAPSMDVSSLQGAIAAASSPYTIASEIERVKQAQAIADAAA